MAAHDTPTRPPGYLAAMAGVSPTDLAEARAVATLRAENAALRLAIETAAADLARAHGAMMLIVAARDLARAHQIADADLVETAVAHRAALKALEASARPAPTSPGTVLPFPGRRA